MQIQAQKKSLVVTSRSFKAGQSIPLKHSYNSDNISPNIAWSKGPEATKSYVLICDDPDAPRLDPWVHWIIFNIPADILELQEGVVSAQQGTNDYGQVGWGGPNPPSGIHKYNFKVYALDDMLSNLSSSTTKKDLLIAMKSKVLAQGSLMGTFAAKK